MRPYPRPATVAAMMRRIERTGGRYCRADRRRTAGRAGGVTRRGRYPVTARGRFVETTGRVEGGISSMFSRLFARQHAPRQHTVYPIQTIRGRRWLTLSSAGRMAGDMRWILAIRLCAWKFTPARKPSKSSWRRITKRTQKNDGGSQLSTFRATCSARRQAKHRAGAAAGFGFPQHDLDPGAGFEPASRRSKRRILPLDDPGISRVVSVC